MGAWEKPTLLLGGMARLESQASLRVQLLCCTDSGSTLAPHTQASPLPGVDEATVLMLSGPWGTGCAG